MPYTKTIPQWNATGSQPPQSLIDNGWQANQKPAADYFNWQWNRVYQVLNELHQFALHSERLGAANGIATLGADSKLTASQLPATPLATTSTSGLMSSSDKSKLDGVAANANNYVHPATHPASMITEDTTRRFVTDTEKATWNAKASTAVATTSANGLMSSADKTKLDSVATGANNYVHPTGDGNQHVPATGTTNNDRFLKAGSTAGSFSWQTILAGDVSGLQALLDGKSDKGHGHNAATTSAAGFMAAADKSKLDGIESGAQVNQNSFSIVKVGATNVVADSTSDTLELIAGTNITLTPNATNDTVTITNSTPNVTTSVAGLMSAADKTKLDGVAANANNYVHPSTHPATMITTDASNRFVSDTEKATWNAKASTAVATTSVNGLMSSGDKFKMDRAQIFKMVNDLTGEPIATTTRPQATGVFLYTGTDKTWFPGLDGPHVIENRRIIYGATSKYYTFQFFHYTTQGSFFSVYDDDTMVWTPWSRMATMGDVNSALNETNALRNELTSRTTFSITALTGGATVTGTGNAAYKEGGRVYFELICTLPNGMTSGTVIATLPSALRPAKLTYMPLQANSGQFIQFAINTSGQLIVNSPITSGTAVSIYGSFSLNPLR